MKKNGLLIILMLITGIYASAYDFKVNGIYYNMLSDNECEVTYKEKVTDYEYKSTYSGNIRIPEYINIQGEVLKVTGVGDYAFWYCTNLNSITLPNSIKEIGDYAFYECQNLKNIIVPNSVIKIGKSAFGFCRTLSSLTLGSSLKTIGWYATKGCYQLEKLYSLSTEPPVLNKNIYNDIITFDERVYSKSILYVPKLSYEKYINSKGWHRFKYIQTK